jgi:hypothetical protein
MESQLAASLRVRDLVSTLHVAIQTLDGLEQQTNNLQETIRLSLADVPEEVASAFEGLLEKVDEHRKTLVRRETPTYGTATKLLGKLRGWSRAIDSANAAPTSYQSDYVDKLQAEHGVAISETNRIVREEVPAVNEILERHNLPTLLASEVTGP